MNNNAFGRDYNSHKKVIFYRILCCIISIISLLLLNLLFLFFRNEIGKILSFIINFLLDFIVLTLVTIYYDFQISNDLIILRLFKQKKYTFNGVIEEIATDSVMYNKLECFVVTINNKKYYSPVVSKIEFIVDKPVVISIVKEIILEVEYE